MVRFCDDVAREIVSATGPETVDEVIRNSFHAFREKRNSFNERAYVINMIVTLQASKPNVKTIPEVMNISHAIRRFREFNSTDTNDLF